MYPITKKIWSHLSIDQMVKNTNREVRISKPKIVKSFRELVGLIAKISYHNPHFSIFYRGQNKDYARKGGLSRVYPSSFRRQPDNSTLEEITERLKKAEELFLKKSKSFFSHGYDKLVKYRELRWAILQHYEVCPTPLLDITHSLKAASSFALNNATDEGVLLVFGFPYPYGSISYLVEEELLIVKLLSICPPQAMRPYYQEAYLVGTFPTSVDVEDMDAKLDVGRRLVAKFILKKKSFWDKDFQNIPDEALFPNNDPMRDICDEIKRNI